VLVGDFNTPHHQKIGHINKKINKEILELNYTTDQMDLPDVYGIFRPTSIHYIFFSAAHGIFSKIDHILGQKASLSKYKKIEIIPCILSDHSSLKLEIKNKINNRKYVNSWNLNNTLLNYQWGIDEIKEEVKRFLKVNENESRTCLNLWNTA
jgi:hypothetical protein